jgi:hypothetical protein
MNLFYLDEDFEKCAQAHVDKHIVKMPLEVAQLLCTAIWVDEHLGFIPRALTKPESDKLNALKKEIKHLSPEERPLTPYLPMMYNHPCTIWVRSSLDNFEWTHCYGNALNEEYCYRYGKRHKSIEEVVNKLPEPKNMLRVGFTRFGLAMPDVLKDYDNPIQSYRDYYHLDKATFAAWTGRSKPDWWREDLADYHERITRSDSVYKVR